MKKQYYIKMNEKLMASNQFHANEKIFLAFLEVLTDKGTIETDKSNTFFSAKMNLSTTYVSTIIKTLKEKGAITVGKKYARRVINIDNVDELVKRGLISKKAERTK